MGTGTGTQYTKSGSNCNYGTRLGNFPSHTVESCAGKCDANTQCKSFGIWTGLDKGYCILWYTAYTSPCPAPTSVATGYTNDVYNKQDIHTADDFCRACSSGKLVYSIPTCLLLVFVPAPLCAG